MSKTKNPDAPKAVSRLHPIIHDIEPLLEQTGTFTLDQTPYGGSDAERHAKGAIRKCVDNGALRKVGRVHSSGKLRVQYRWSEGAREYLNDYLSNLDKLPCQCRVHIPDSRDDPEGKISCKHCGDMYDEQRFKELVTE